MSSRAAKVNSWAVLLRGINLGGHNRIAMPALREALSDSGFADVRTYVQSGNIVLGASSDEKAVVDAVEALLAERFGLQVPVVVRDAKELAAVVAENPLPEAAEEAPKLLQVTFLSARLSDEVAEHLRGLSTGKFSSDTEAISVSASGRNIYGWHPGGIHASTLARELSDRKLGVTTTARNWTTVTTLLQMTAE